MKIYSCLLALLMVVSLVLFTACGKGKNKNNEGGSKTEGITTEWQTKPDGNTEAPAVSAIPEPTGTTVTAETPDTSTPDQTTKKSDVTTKAPETTKAATTAKATEKTPETTAKSPDVTTASPETTAKPAETTAKPAVTTKYYHGIILPEDSF